MYDLPGCIPDLDVSPTWTVLCRSLTVRVSDTSRSGWPSENGPGRGCIQTEVASRTTIHPGKNVLRAGTFWRLVVTYMYASSLQCVYLAPQCPLLPHTAPTTPVSAEHVSGEKGTQKTNGLTEFQQTPPTCQQGKGGRWEEGAVREKK